MSTPTRRVAAPQADSTGLSRTVAQSIRMIEAGCELVRITAPSKKEAENLAEIKKQLRAQGYSTPLVADIHFTPNAAEIAARIVEKVRVNPGNYADKKKFDVREYTDDQYHEELERIRERFGPVVADIVLANSDFVDDGGPRGGAGRWFESKRDYLEGFPSRSPAALRVCLADKLHNARSILLDYRTEGEHLWTRFSAGRDEQLWYYRALASGFEVRRGDLGEAAGPAVDELRRVVEEIALISGSTT